MASPTAWLRSSIAASQFDPPAPDIQVWALMVAAFVFALRTRPGREGSEAHGALLPSAGLA